MYRNMNLIDRIKFNFYTIIFFIFNKIFRKRAIKILIMCNTRRWSILKKYI